MGAFAQPPSKYVLTDLTMRSMIELERAKAGLDFENDVLRDLSCALLTTYDAEGSASSLSFIEPSLYEPYERFASHVTETEPSAVARIQSYLKYFSTTLSRVVDGDTSPVAALIPICTSLHRELVQEINAEVVFGVNDWPSVHEEPAAGVSAA